MPVAIRFSRQFYDRLGEEVADELVAVLNLADDTYHREFRDLLDVRFDSLESRLRQMEAGVNARFSGLEARFDTKLNALEGRFDTRLDALESRFDAKLNALEARVDAKLNALKADLLRWMFLFWVGTMGTVVALLKL